jgi:hypothetical protein
VTIRALPEGTACHVRTPVCVAGLLLSYFIVFADFGGVLALFYGWLVVGDRLGPFYVSLLRKKKKKKKNEFVLHPAGTSSRPATGTRS